MGLLCEKYRADESTGDSTKEKCMKRKLIGVCLMVGMFMGSTVFGQPKMPFVSKTLDNGLDVIVIQNKTVPLVTIEIAVKNGAYTESPQYDGLSHLYEHMFFKANKKYPSQEAYMERVRELGISFNGTTSDERVDYFITLSKDSINAGMQFMEYAIRYPLFLKSEMEKENHVVTGEFDRNEASPFFQLYRAMNKKMWPKYYSRKNTIGDRKVILSATPEKMHTIQHRYYIPNNSALLIAGDVEPEQAFALAKKYFSTWKRGPNPFKKFPIPEHPPLKATVDTIITQPVNVAMSMIGWHGPKALDDMKSTYAADVFSTILSQKTSKFQKHLVDSGIALQANLNYSTLQYTGPIVAQIVSQPMNAKKALDAFFAEIPKWSDPDYFTDEQLKTAKNLLEVDAIYSQEKASEYVHTVSYWWAITGLNYYRDYFKNLRAVTRQDIQNYLNKYIIGQPHVIATVVNPKTKEALQLTEGSLVK